ncbi:MAG: hypothetical protein EP338_01755 [Bacteroidetes bacterium]|nr:MAG: hypothetical protein EP338_01755 [Bacteroidota bacterium]
MPQHHKERSLKNSKPQNTHSSELRPAADRRSQVNHQQKIQHLALQSTNSPAQRMVRGGAPPAPPARLYHMLPIADARLVQAGGLGLPGSDTYGATSAGLAANRRCSPQDTVILRFTLGGIPRANIHQSSATAWYVDRGHQIPVANISVLNHQTRAFAALAGADLTNAAYYDTRPPARVAAPVAPAPVAPGAPARGRGRGGARGGRGGGGRGLGAPRGRGGAVRGRGAGRGAPPAVRPRWR